MVRRVVAFCLVFLSVCSVGCRMCCTPYDYRVSGYIDRSDDYRGFDPMYRAGSIFGQGTCPVVCGDTYFVRDTGDLYNNAGNYGVTTLVSAVHRDYVPTESSPQTNSGSIAIPQRSPENNGMTIDPSRNGIDSVPTIQDLIKQPRGTTPVPEPITPPARPKVVLPPVDDPSIETIPFSPSDQPRIVPPGMLPTQRDTELPITLEELRRLDPSIKDVQIISIEDAGLESMVK